MPEEKSMAGKSVVVTGATAGLGLYSLIALVGTGACGIGIGRDPARCAQAEAQIKTAYPNGCVAYFVADLSRQSEIHRVAGEIRNRLSQTALNGLDVLVNNAGTYSGKRIYTEDGVELMLAVNHVASFLLTHLLLPLLTSAPAGRIITVSSGSHYKTNLRLARINNPLIYFGLDRYKVTKLANVLFTYELNRRLAGTRVRAFAADPGLINTNMGAKGTGKLAQFVWKYRRQSGRPPEVPAQNILFLSSEPSLQPRPEIYWRDCHPKPPDPQAEREDLAAALWQRSLELCGLTQ
jgi:NAD(P)-dependent dehydrogenase (short-subunit alcohol dehydrogenase family)